MSLEISHIEFEETPPSIEEIVKYVSKVSSQVISAENQEDESEGIQNQFFVYLKNQPGEQLELQINKNSIAVFHYVPAAPALFQILCTCLIRLGGKTSDKIGQVKLPISEKEIKEFDHGFKERVQKSKRRLFFRLLLVLVSIGALTYLGISLTK